MVTTHQTETYINIMVSGMFCVVNVFSNNISHLWARDTATGFAMPILDVSLLNRSSDAIASAIRFCVARFNSSFSLTKNQSR